MPFLLIWACFICVAIGVSLNNLGSKFGEAELPSEIKAGIAYRLLKDRLTLGAGLDSGEKTRLHLGAEYLLFDRFAIRGGLEANEGRKELDEGTGLSLGLGVNFNRFRLDYAMVPYGDLGNTHRVSLAANFGGEERARRPFVRVKEGKTKRIAILNFVNNTGKAEFDWLIKTIPNLLTTELSNSNYLGIIDPDWVEELLKKGLNEREIAKETKADILVKGSFSRSGSTFRIDAKTVDASSFMLLVACSVDGSANRLFDLVYDLAWELDRKLYFKLNPGVEETSYKAPVGIGKALTHLPDLSIEKMEIGNIFPSKYNYYTEHPIGKVTLKNNISDAFNNVKVRINIPKFMSLPSEIEVGEILANSSKEVLLKVALDNTRLLEINENTPTPVEIKAIYYKQGKEVEIALNKSVVFFDRNAIDWENPESVAAFVTPKDDVVKTFSRKVLGSVPIKEAELPVRILQAASIFEALGLYPLTYISDPSSSFRGEVFDYVQYPAETLEFKSGDCDDFTVLYASLLENVGIETKLVNTTSHIFLLFDSGITKKNSYLVSLDEKDFVLIGDRLFIPVETTKVGSSFIQAWRSGAEEYDRWQLTPTEVSLIDLHSAWQTYPSMALAGKAKEVKIPEAEQLLVKLKEDDRQFKLKQEDAYKELLEELRKKPATSDVCNQIAKLQSCMGKNEAAERTLKECLVTDQTSASLYNNLGNLYLLRKDFTGAKKYYKMALANEENESGVLLNLGVAYFLEDDEEKALEYFEQAVMLSGSLEEIYHKLGLIAAEEELRASDAKERLIGKVKRLLKIAAERAERLTKTPESSLTAVVGTRGAEEAIDLSTLLYWKN